jgi:hypothetical protein
VFRFTMVDAENAESLGVVAFARSSWRAGDTIPQGPGRTLRVVNVIEPDPGMEDKQLPVLVVELTK